MTGLHRTPASRRLLASAAAVLALGLTAVFALAPPAGPSADQRLASFAAANAQSYIAEHSSAAGLARDPYSATDGMETFIRSGTNHDWAKLVLLFGGWPVSENNVTVITRWMRQENFVDSWWNRNNPLNNGWGSGGGSGLGSYGNLVIAAAMAAENLHRHPGFQPIVDCLARSAPTAETERAIWSSPWASGHYGNGARWHYEPVEVVTAPPDRWD